ncbi:hypothetical protein ECZU42_51170 [Escherichia coli]|nr:hypothetical protein ECZU42_51170 [Escherichia coli]
MEASTIAAILLGSVAGVLADWHVPVASPHAHWPTVVRSLPISTTGGGASGAVPESHQHDPQFPECLHLAMAQW